MNTSVLPGTDVNVPKICLGCWQFNDGEQSGDKTWDAQPLEVSKSIVDKGLELGVNFLDTAEGYLNSESVVGRITEGRRRNFLLATKFGVRVNDYTGEEIEKSINNSLQKLKTDYIDLYQVHWPIFIEKNLQDCVNELNRQVAKGTIRHYGVCNFGPKNLKAFLEAGGKPVTNQISYSLLWRAVEYEIVPMCQQNGIGVLAYSPLQQGLLSGKYLQLSDVPEGRRRTRLFNANSTELSRHGGEGAEDEMFKAINSIKSTCDSANLNMAQTSLSWLTQQEGVTSVIVGARNPQQLEGSSKLQPLGKDMLQKLSDITKGLKDKFGANPDMWAQQSRIA